MTVATAGATSDRHDVLRSVVRGPLWIVVAVFVTLGVALRLAEYLANFSLNHDDICLALNVITRGARGLMHTLEFEQAAPLGFLWAERLAIVSLGDGQRALRLLPLVSGCLSVPCFWLLAARLTPPFEAIAATGFFAMSQTLIGASVGVKPYSLDVLIAILLIWLYLPIVAAEVDRAVSWTASLVGAVSLWISFPAIFVLGSIGIAIAAPGLQRARRAALFRHAPFLALWAASAGLAYWYSARPGLLNPRVVSHRHYEFPLHDPHLMVVWVLEALQNLGSISTSVRLAPVAAIVFAISLGSAILRRSRTSIALAVPILLAFLASVLQRYPWIPRLIFFLVPLLLLLAALECGALMRSVGTRPRRVAALLIIIALAYSALSAVKNVLFEDPGFDDPRGAVASILAHWQPGDHIYASDAGLPPLIYYGSMLNSDSRLSFVSPRKPAYTPSGSARYVPLPTREGRLWFIYFVPNEIDYDQDVLSHFAERAELLERTQFKHYVVTLWLLSASASPPQNGLSP